jgi:RecB family exonuclease
MTRYSNSRLNTFNQCKKQYKFKYIDREEKDFDNTVEAFMGDLVHRTLEKLYYDLKYEKLNSLDELIEYYEDMWEDEWNEDILIVKTQFGAENYKKKGLKMIRGYYEEYAPFENHSTIGIETTHMYSITEDHDIHIRIDQLCNPEPGVYEIRDFKTANNLPTYKYFEEENKQLAIYALGIRELYPDAETIKLIWHYLAFNKEIVVEKTDAELDEIEQEIIEEIRDAENAEEFPPTKSPLCDYCAYKSKCPLWKHLYMEDVPEEIDEDVRDFINLKREQERREEKIEELKETISKYMEKHDLQRVFDEQGRNVYRWSKDVYRLPRKGEEGYKKLRDAVEALGLLDEYSKVDTWNLQKAIDSLGPVEQEVLKKIAETDRIERFYVND